MESAGPDDPCPCGSRRKYRLCCAAEDDARRAARACSRTRESAISKLLTFAFQPAFDSDHAIAEVVFWGKRVQARAPGQLEWLLDSEDATVKYNAWFLFDWDVDGQGTVADLFLEEQATGLTVVERQFLNRLARAHLRLYEVEAVVRGRGLRLLDLWTGERIFVIERTATAQVVTWDLLGARVAPDGLGGRVFEGGLYLYPAEVRDQVLGHFRRLQRRYQRKRPGEDPELFFRRHGMAFHHLWLDLVAFPEPPQLTTAEGDPLMFCRVVFDTTQVEHVRAAMSVHPDLQAIEDGRFVWSEATPDGTRELGRWSAERRRVVFDTTSQGRAERGRAWLEALAGDRVKYRATALETVEHTMNELRRRRPAMPHDRLPDAGADAVRELYDRHYHQWLDRPEPALGNRTPRAAAQTRVWQTRVVDRLKQLENAAERAALAGRAPYDFQWIWTELGLDRPGTRSCRS